MLTDDLRPALLAVTDDFVVADKPAGLETISETGDTDTLNLVRKELAMVSLTPVHRLDRDTSGAVIFAKTWTAETELVKMFRQRTVEKTYSALCVGVPRNRTGSINRHLSEWNGGHRPVKVLKRGGLEAVTQYRLIDSAVNALGEKSMSLVSFYPHQGRTHQIRVHAAAIGYPIVGDDQYGDRPANVAAKRVFGLRRQALHCAKLKFLWKGRDFVVVCPPPSDMNSIIQQCFNYGTGV